ncbi:MAG TPA: DinB family protein [Vicinamibacteria bacterium]|nr:DinB family protein [Vicinamibacteria bacterium]
MDLATIRALYRYNSWANERTLDAVSRISLADLSRDMKSSHGSIRDTLTHVVWSEWIWLQRWKGVSPTARFSPTDYPTVESLREAFRAVDAERSTVLGQLTAERLLHIVEYTNLKGETWRYPLWQQLHHVVNHGTYHRGQVVTMLRQLGATPEATDLLVYYDQQSA